MTDTPDLALGRAWLKRHKRRPTCTYEQKPPYWKWERSRKPYSWPSELPETAFSRLTGMGSVRRYPTEAAALDDAARAVAEALAAGEIEP